MPDHPQHHRAHIADAERRRSVGREICSIIASVGLRPKSIVDIGCGYGYFLAEAKRYFGTERILGLDGTWIEEEHSDLAGEEFRKCDLNTSIEVSDRFDLAASLEVGEHLEKSAASMLVGALTSCAPIVLFSAAIPGQGGRGHLNEQYLDFWGAMFRDAGFVCVDILHPYIWNNPKLFLWFRQNLVLFVAEDVLERYQHFRPYVVDCDLMQRIHPEVFAMKIHHIKKLKQKIRHLEDELLSRERAG